MQSIYIDQAAHQHGDYAGQPRPAARRSETARPLRILHISPYFSDAWGYGGIPRLAGTLTRGLARLGHDVTVCTTDARDGTGRASQADARTDEGVTLRVFPNFSNTLAYRFQLFLPLGLDRYLRAHAREFDVAHLHACRNVPGAIAARHLVDARVPYVLEPNGTAPAIEQRRLAKRGFDAIAGRRMLANAARVVAVSDTERHQLLQLGVDPAAICLVPNPIDLDEFARPIPRGHFRRKLGLPSGKIVMFLGRITPRKRVGDLARAFARLNRTDAWLVIAGNDIGTGRQLRQLTTELGIDHQTRFTGLLRSGERLEALADADVVVYPSQHEIFGLVPLESLLAGSPVVVADDSGCGEVVGNVGGGLVTPLGDVDSLASAIRTMLDAEAEWRLAASRAAERVRARYGDRVVCDLLERVYHEVLGEG